MFYDTSRLVLARKQRKMQRHIDCFSLEQVIHTIGRTEKKVQRHVTRSTTLCLLLLKILKEYLLLTVIYKEREKEC